MASFSTSSVTPISFCSFAFRIIRENTLSFSDCLLHSYGKWNIIIKDMNLTSIYISEKFHIISCIIRMSIYHREQNPTDLQLRINLLTDLTDRFNNCCNPLIGK